MPPKRKEKVNRFANMSFANIPVPAFGTPAFGAPAADSPPTGTTSTTEPSGSASTFSTPAFSTPSLTTGAANPHVTTIPGIKGFASGTSTASNSLFRIAAASTPAPSPFTADPATKAPPIRTSTANTSITSTSVSKNPALTTPWAKSPFAVKPAASTLFTTTDSANSIPLAATRTRTARASATINPTASTSAVIIPASTSSASTSTASTPTFTSAPVSYVPPPTTAQTNKNLPYRPHEYADESSRAEGEISTSGKRPSPRQHDRKRLMLYSSFQAKGRPNYLTSNHRLQEIRAAPIFSAKVQDALESDESVIKELAASKQELFPQFSMLGNKMASFSKSEWKENDVNDPDNLVFCNFNEPFSTFICGSQGSGKSHTLSCMLEGALLRNNPVGQIKAPSAAMVFHYDQFSSHTSAQVCEAAYLCSRGIPVRVIVSPTNYDAMVKAYTNLDGLKNFPKPKVIPFHLKEEHLHVQNMKTLMSCAGGEAALPLYLDRVFSILKDLAMEKNSTKVGIDYQKFRKQLESETFSREQKGPLGQRLTLLDDFLTRHTKVKLDKNAKKAMDKVWQFEPGSLTIVDLSCPFVSAADACSLFTVALSIFLETRGKGDSRLIALDEAHKFLIDAPEAIRFTEELVSIIAQQRHLASRVIIATQEPTLSPRLLEMSNVSIVHHFKSPNWFATLQSYLAGPSGTSSPEKVKELFQKIVNLKTGEAFVFAPSAVTDIIEESKKDRTLSGLESVKQQGTGVFKVMVRKRITVDGGRSIVAV